MSEILNGVCKGGPLNDRGLTHDRPFKVLVASNHDGQGGAYHYAGKNAWIWQAEGEESPLSDANELEKAPRITPEIIDQRIRQVKYYVFPGTTVTICAIELMNGYHVIGESACASRSNYDEAIGRRIAYDDARRKIWALEGYVLRNELLGL